MFRWERWLSVASILPFDQNPESQGLDFFTAYWVCSICDASYSAEVNSKTVLYSLANGIFTKTINLPGSVIPVIDYAVYPSNRATLTVTGTRFFLEFVNQILGVNLVDVDPWAGEVGQYWSSISDQLWDLVELQLAEDGITEVAFFGHSQGGAICQLFPDLAFETGGISVANLVTLGTPRTGNVEYATTQLSNYVRLTNAGDPIPALPAAVSTPLDEFLWIIPPTNLNSYQHWGTRFHLFDDGFITVPPELPTWSRGFEAMLLGVRASGNWFADHRAFEYARRLRLNLPSPVQVVHADYLGLKEIDDYFAGINLQPSVGEWFFPPTCQ